MKFRDVINYINEAKQKGKTINKTDFFASNIIGGPMRLDDLGLGIGKGNILFHSNSTISQRKYWRIMMEIPGPDYDLIEFGIKMKEMAKKRVKED